MKPEIVERDVDARRRALRLFAEAVLRPIIRILLRHGTAYAEFNQIARKVYVDVAMQEPEFRLQGKKRQSKSRCACITGLSRKEVLRLDEAPRPADDPELRSSNRAERVLDGWLNDTRYVDSQGRPLPLPFKASEGRRSFSQLVHDFSGDITPRAVLQELLRSGSCAAWGDDEIRVRKNEYIPHAIDVEVLTAAAMQIAARIAQVDVALNSGDRTREPSNDETELAAQLAH